MNKNTVVKRTILTLFTIAAVSYIFINSSYDASASDAQSLGIRQMINDFLHSININITLTNHFVRKCAHFTEFFLLGTLLFYTVKSYLSKLDFRIMIAPALGLVVASIDETIQIFSDGRSAQLSDVLLDFSGVCTAVLLKYTFYRIHKYKSNKKHNKG